MSNLMRLSWLRLGYRIVAAVERHNLRRFRTHGIQF